MARDTIEAVDPGRAERLRSRRLRRRIYQVKGPNHIWHVDGNDKLKPYGLCISACMDGYSRRLIWLTVARTNKNPNLICSYFLTSIHKIGMLPRVVRLDRGTENVNIAKAQTALRSQHGDSLASTAVMYGASTHNQRIERFWLYLRQTLLQDYMTLFRGYLDSGIVDSSNPLHMECLAFCFLPVLRQELQSLLLTWNNHRVRNMKNSGCPSGIPNILFHYPDMYGAENQTQHIDQQTLARCFEQDTNHNIVDFQPDFKQWALSYMCANSIATAGSMEDACSLFSKLIVEVYKCE